MRHCLALITLALLITLAGCTSAPAPAPTASPAAVTTITFGLYSYQRAGYEPLVEQFHAANPDMRVQLILLDDMAEPGPADAALAELAGTADTFVAWGSFTEALDRRYVRDLAPFIDADPSFERDDFFPGALRADPAGVVTLLPATLRVPLLAYNRELWAAAGLPAPTSDWTWAEILDAATRLAQREGDEVTAYGLLLSTRRELLTNGALAGVDSLLQTVPAGQARLDDPALVVAVERASQLLSDGSVLVPPTRGDGTFFNSTDYLPLLRGGQLGMWPSFAAILEPADALPFAVGLAPLPPGPLETFGTGREGYLMSAGTQHPEAAWRWLSFLSRQPPVATGRERPNDLPARRSLAETSASWRRLGDEGQAATLATLEQIARLPAEPAFAATPEGWPVYSAVSGALDAVLDEGTPAPEALRTAQGTLEERLANRPPVEPTPEASVAPVVVATPVPTVAAAANASRITFVTTDWNTAALERLATRFNEQFPQYLVTVQRFDFPSGRSVTVDEPAATGDCGQIWAPPSTTNDSAVFLDLQPLVDADPSFPLADYPVALLAPFRHEGKLLGLPNGLVPPVLFFNRALFDAVGEAYPSADWTLADFSAAAERLTSGSGDSRQYGFAAVSHFNVFFYLGRAGTRVDQRRAGLQKPDFTNAQAIAAIQDYLTLLRAVAPNETLDGYRWESGPGVMSLITEGRVAMWFGHGFDPSQGDLPFEFPTGVAPLPLGERPLASDDLFSVSGLFISAEARDPAACWAFLRFLSEDSTRFWREMPARTSLAQSPAFLERMPSGVNDVLTAYSAALTSRPPPPAERVVTGLDYYWLMRAIDRAFQGGDLERELADAQFFTEQYLACALSGERPAVCARQVDPTYDGWFRE